ncbi:hypothetical protein PIB30_075684 [Stylosanthes scabra]|uniref:Uncharacterized protein n=1 Tax=Stylosanthes scabra TaxID=79078 RepID=A0ABU6RQH3_9FABA|nr:hypothetical protein [Stylosanthes scabra]
MESSKKDGKGWSIVSRKGKKNVSPLEPNSNKIGPSKDKPKSLANGYGKKPCSGLGRMNTKATSEMGRASSSKSHNSLAHGSTQAPLPSESAAPNGGDRPANLRTPAARGKHKRARPKSLQNSPVISSVVASVGQVMGKDSGDGKTTTELQFAIAKSEAQKTATGKSESHGSDGVVLKT